MRLSGKVALITGSGGGIGRATAILFAKEGAKVVVNDISTKAGNETVEMIKAIGGDAIFVQGDVTKGADCQRMVQTAVITYGKLTTLVNNAGGFEYIAPVVETSEEDYQKIMDVNVKSIFLVSKYAIPEMIKSGGGSIINRGSTNSHIGFPGIAAYNASKGAVLQLTKNMTLDYLPNNIRVNAVSPGPIMTPAAAAAFRKNPDLEKETIARIPVGRLGKPEEVAYADLFLASDESSYITGISLLVDGGYTAQ
jgi:NAD(P)-dependent dehydrogenase (short-subunit alcohol dehydrogenase family)